MKKSNVSKKPLIGQKGWIIIISVLALIIAMLITLLILQANGVLYPEKPQDNPVEIIQPQRADNEVLTEGNYQYVRLVDGTVMITGYLEINEIKVTVPSTIAGYKVSAIGANAYTLSLIKAQEIFVPEGVTYIGEKAFYGAQNAVLYLPSTIAQINHNALQGFENPSAIYFAGTRQQWNAVKIGSGNKQLSMVICQE